ncbi:hypothetical protein AMTR_s00114p00018540 [Amborella trichopoda]|uniref:Uncharacterized protein n=1 Tax=Amborella trichopoda TaxID=13333 RepID=W1NU83_AMBTC|nr:hypothetical protein AMTR_s00114p00018540 [Amborella trichopoda]
MSKPWGGGITSWAAETELAEAEEQEQLELQRAAAAPAEPSFPTLREATASKPKKKKQVLWHKLWARLKSRWGTRIW